MNPKEIYLTVNDFENEISRLRSDINRIHVRERKWNAVINESALIILDLQHYFFSSSSHAYIPSAHAILGKIKMIADFYRKHQRPVIFTRHLNDDDDAGSMAYWWSDLVRENTRESELIGDIKEQGDIVMIKSQFDAFYKTELQDILLSRNVVYPVICGVMTNLCCETTTRSAFVRGFRPVMPIDATAAYNREYHLATFRNLCYGFMPLLTTDEIVQILQE